MAMAFALAAASLSYQPTFLAPANSLTCARSTQGIGAITRAAGPRMVAAKDVFGQYYEAAPTAQKTMSSLPPPVAKLAMGGLVAATGAVGFVLTPSRKIVVEAVGGGLTAVLGNKARKRLMVERQKAAMPAVAAILAQGLASAEPDTLSAVASEYNVPKKDFQGQLGELYLAFLNACLASPAVETSELSELLKLQGVLKLSFQQVGTQVHNAAKQLYSRHRAYLEDEDDNESKRLLQKFVFLAESVLSKDDSPEGYRFESLRLQKLFSLTAKEWEGKAEAAAVPFYEKALTSAVIDAMPSTTERITGIRQSLGIGEGCAAGMHVTVYGRAAQAMLEAGAFSAEDKARLREVESLLELTPDMSSSTLRSLTSEPYRATAEEVLGRVGVDGDADAHATLSARRDGLLLEAADAAAIELQLVRARAGEILSAAVDQLRVQSTAEGLATVQSLLAYCRKIGDFLLSAGRLEGLASDSAESATDALATTFGPIRNEVKASEVLSLYRVLLLEYLKDLKVSEAQERDLAQLRAVLGLSQAEADSVYQAAAGPLFRGLIKRLTEAEFGAAQKAELASAVSDLALSEEVTTQLAIDVYSERLSAFATDAKILSEEQAESLRALREFLDLPMERLYAKHDELCSEMYATSVKEVMGTSGIIPDEYWDGLATLRERLCLSEEAAMGVFSTEVTVKMKTFGQKALDAMEEKGKQQQAAQEKGESAGKMGIEDSQITTEVLNLVEFAEASKALVYEEEGGKEVAKVGASLRGQFDSRDLKNLYRQYLVEAFSGNDAAQNQKLFNNLPKASLVLGLDSREEKIIHDEIGSMVYRQYVARALKKGPLGPEEMNVLGSIKSTLGMDDAKCEELIRDQQLNRVSILMEMMFEKDSVLAEDVRKMREEAELYDVDLLNELQVSRFKLERCYLCEVEDLVDTGVIHPGDLSALEEVNEQLHISEERGSQMLQETVEKRVSGGVLQAASLLRQDAMDSACKELQKVLRYAAILDDVVAQAPSVSAKERNDLYTLFQASQLAEGGATPDAAAQLELLKSVMAIGEATPA